MNKFISIRPTIETNEQRITLWTGTYAEMEINLTDEKSNEFQRLINEHHAQERLLTLELLGDILVELMELNPESIDLFKAKKEEIQTSVAMNAE